MKSRRVHARQAAGRAAGPLRRLGVLLLPCLLAAPAPAAAPAPPSQLVAEDYPWDNGTRIRLTWDGSPDDGELLEYRIYLATISLARAAEAPPGAPGDEEFHLVEAVPAGTTTVVVDELTPENEYWFRLVAVAADGTPSAVVSTSEPLTPQLAIFDSKRGWFLLTTVIFCGSVILFIQLARSGRPLRVRKIAGLEAVDEAVGRATEMGRSCLFVPGIQDMNEIQTIAGINILARVAKTAANYDARIEVPTARSLVMTTARETVHAAFLEAGRPDAFNEDLIYYVTDEQFGYVAYLQGMMVREKPAACFYMGAFYAESLILAETGNNIGAIQVAGTAQPAQLPFFVAACDYTLIGEEFFAASAYLTGSPEELGSLKGQDVGKIIVGGGILAGVLGLTVASILGPESQFGVWLYDAVQFFKNTMLT